MLLDDAMLLEDCPTCPLPAPMLLPAGLEDVTLGTLEDLRRASKGGMDPNGLGAARLASDVLWSDPVGGGGDCSWGCRGIGWHLHVCVCKPCCWSAAI